MYTLSLWDKTSYSPTVGESNVDRYSPVQSSGGQCWPGSRYSIVRECLCAERQKQDSSLNLVNILSVPARVCSCMYVCLSHPKKLQATGMKAQRREILKLKEFNNLSPRPS